MSLSMQVVNLSRLQFAFTAMVHFLFVPLTLGLSWLLAIMESVFVMTDKTVWRQMTQFWGALFGINFAIGVATGLTMEFQFGTHWSYYSHYVGDIFGAPLAIEGLMAFFLEATLVGLFFFGWNRLSKVGHLAVTWFLALGTNLSALWILIANGWMQNPVGSFFNFETMRMEVSDFAAVIFNPVAQTKFVHTVSAGYVTGSMFVLSISAYYLLRHRHVELAKRSIIIAASFGLASALSVVVLGDESGYVSTFNQHIKIAAMEAMWHTEPAPADFMLFGIHDQKTKTSRYTVRIPYLLGLIATRSIDTPLPGIEELLNDGEKRIIRGQKAYGFLQELKNDPKNLQKQQKFGQYADDLGYGLLLKRYTTNVTDATPAQIEQAKQDLLPKVNPLFFSFRIMVLCGFFFIALFATSFYLATKRRLQKPWFLWTALFSLPLPWISCFLGWFVAEYGRQPWAIEGILPTFLGASALTVTQATSSLLGFIVFYTILTTVEMFLMVKYIRLGPDYVVNDTERKTRKLGRS